MESSWPENLPTDRRKVIDKLIRGRYFANQLRTMLSKPIEDDDGSTSAGDLAMKILGSFTETLSILNSSESDEVSQGPATTRLPSTCSDGRRSEDSSESCKTPASKDRRGCYKRRKTTKTWENYTPTLVDDGHAWRKYGQKVILNSKYPRNYFRCTHKFDQDCQATKQVQQTEDDPTMYRITYNGHHSCKKLHKAPQMFSNSTSTGDSSVFLSFKSDHPNNKENDSMFASLSFIKQEHKEQLAPSMNHNQSSSSDYLLSPDQLTVFESSDHGDVISSGVYPCTTTTHNFGMEMMMGSVDFDKMFEF